MGKPIETIEKEIEEKEQEIQRLQVAKAILEGKTPSEIVMEKYKVGSKEYHTPRRKIKCKRWSDVEVKQLINLYNSLNLKYGKKLTRIANTLKMPRKRIANKIYHLQLLGILETLETKPKKKVETPYKKLQTKWTKDGVEKVKEMTNNGLKPKEISRRTGIDRRAISNKIYELRKQGLLSNGKEKKHGSIIDVFRK